jgi:hypothetical protein
MIPYNIKEAATQENWELIPFYNSKFNSRGKKTNQHLGDFWVNKDNGVKIYLSRRVMTDRNMGLFKDGNLRQTFSETLKNGQALWQFSVKELNECRKQNIEIIGLRDVITGSLWLTTKTKMLTNGKIRVYKRTTEMHYYLNENEFVKKIFAPPFNPDRKRK